MRHRPDRHSRPRRTARSAATARADSRRPRRSLPKGGAPLDLSAPVPLLDTTSYHAGEPVFVTLADANRNEDPLLRDAIDLRITTSGGRPGGAAPARDRPGHRRVRGRDPERAHPAAAVASFDCQLSLRRERRCSRRTTSTRPTRPTPARIRRSSIRSALRSIRPRARDRRRADHADRRRRRRARDGVRRRRHERVPVDDHDRRQRHGRGRHASTCSRPAASASRSSRAATTASRSCRRRPTRRRRPSRRARSRTCRASARTWSSRARSRTSSSLMPGPTLRIDVPLDPLGSERARAREARLARGGLGGRLRAVPAAPAQRAARPRPPAFGSSTCCRSASATATARCASTACAARSRDLGRRAHARRSPRGPDVAPRRDAARHLRGRGHRGRAARRCDQQRDRQRRGRPQHQPRDRVGARGGGVLRQLRGARRARRGGECTTPQEELEGVAQRPPHARRRHLHEHRPERPVPLREGLRRHARGAARPRQPAARHRGDPVHPEHALRGPLVLAVRRRAGRDALAHRLLPAAQAEARVPAAPTAAATPAADAARRPRPTRSARSAARSRTTRPRRAARPTGSWRRSARPARAGCSRPRATTRARPRCASAIRHEPSQQRRARDRGRPRRSARCSTARRRAATAASR